MRLPWPHPPVEVSALDERSPGEFLCLNVHVTNVNSSINPQCWMPPLKAYSPYRTVVGRRNCHLSHAGL